MREVRVHGEGGKGQTRAAVLWGSDEKGLRQGDAGGSNCAVRGRQIDRSRRVVKARACVCEHAEPKIAEGESAMKARTFVT
jgi:hypothetical protein